MQRSMFSPLSLRRQPFRLLVASAVLVLAGGLMQTAMAAPYGGHGGHGAHGAMPAMGGDMNGMFMAHPRQMERLFESIGATAEQRAQIKQIADAARADLRAQRQAGAPLYEQAQALFAQPSIDEGAAEALRQQMLARHDQASKRTMQAMLEMSRVLTPDQRKALADRMAERRATMERHRAEREAGAGPKR